jgi:predicted MFS family arabinose efflux permease
LNGNLDDKGAPRIAGLGLLFGAIYFVQAVGDPSSGLIAQPVRSLLNDWGESPAAIASFMAVIALPWSLKPLLALLSDFVPLLGSRRRSYLIVSTAAAALGLAVLYFVPLPAGERGLLLALLFVPTLGIAFTDVLADALMIEVGKPRGLTGRLQSVQWFAAYFALLVSGVLGGYLTSSDQHELAFLWCAALWTGSLGLTLAFVREPHREASKAEFRSTADALLVALKAPGLIAICAVMFFWELNPVSSSVNYLHFTGTLGLSEQAYGNGFSLFSAGAMLGSVGYGLYGRRLGTAALLHSAIAAGLAANLLYAGVTSASTFYVASGLSGLAYMTGSLILLDVAARRVPIAAAATVFAVIMALSNLASSVGEALGGYAFEAATAQYGPSTAYRVVLAASLAAIASCWLWVPTLERAARAE